VCLNDNTYKREHIGEALELIKQRTQYQARRRRIQQQLKNVKGGKGRGKKLKNLNKLRECEKNFVNTYNHMISKRVVEFAKKHKCEYIHLEKLSKEGFQDSILRNWSYYELQAMIEYKAERIGIKVRYINPSYTSQTCSKCGYIDKDNRQTQEKFKCTKCGFELNADHNASINIARSTDFIK
jgi:IS605 OrfB family transposase